MLINERIPTTSRNCLEEISVAGACGDPIPIDLLDCKTCLEMEAVSMRYAAVVGRSKEEACDRFPQNKSTLGCMTFP